jgi:Cu-processing system permease protein
VTGPVFTIAAAEFQEGLRNRWLIASIGLLTALAFSLAVLGSAPIGETRASPLSVTTVSLASLSVYLIPLIALMVSFDAIVGERERGTLLLLLTYPISRWQVIAGKFLGHMTILSLAIVLGYGSAGLYLSAQAGASASQWMQFGAMLGSSILMGGAFVALGYLISVTVSSRATAGGIAVATWLLMVVIYDLLLLGAVIADTGQQINGNLFAALMLLNPADVYRLFNLAGSEAANLVTGASELLDASLLSWQLLIGILSLWLLLPLVIATLIFRRQEL